MKLIAWFKSRNWSTHTVIAVAGSLALYIAADPAAQLWIKTTLAAHPQLASLIVLASLAIAKQTPSRSDAGVLAAARTINAAPDAPTASEVDAATTK